MFNKSTRNDATSKMSSEQFKEHTKKQENTMSTQYFIERFSFETVKGFVETSLNTLVRSSTGEDSISTDELARKESQRKLLVDARKTSIYGNYNLKNYLKDYITDLITKQYGVTDKTVGYIMSFSERTLRTIDKFDILMHYYKKLYGDKGFEKLVYKYNLCDLKFTDDNVEYSITEEDICRVFENEKIVLTFSDKLKIIVQRIYQDLCGIGVVDDLRDMSINGLSLGVNGVAYGYIDSEAEFEYVPNKLDFSTKCKRYDSVWVHFEGKNVRLKFITLGSTQELQRICSSIYSYDDAGQLSKSNGYKVNRLADGSRVVVGRPPFCESWFCIIRKFNVSDKELEDIVVGKNADIVIDLLTAFSRSCCNVAYTGEQGVGKTTLLLLCIKYLYDIYNIRVIEIFFELALSRKYTDKNILSFQEIANISCKDALDMSKKLDGDYLVVGEVAQDSVVPVMLEGALVAYKGISFSHHAKTAVALVKSLSNSLLKTGMFRSEKVAEEQVVSVLQFDIHLEKSLRNKIRRITRITEIIPINNDNLYYDNDEDTYAYSKDYKKETNFFKKFSLFLDNINTFFTRTTNPRAFMVRDLIIYDKATDGYKVLNKLSDERKEAILNNLQEEHASKFAEFCERVGL